MTSATGGRRAAAGRLGAKYAAGLILAQLAAVTVGSLVIVSLSSNTVGDARSLLTEKNLIALCALAVLSISVGTVAGVVNMRPSFQWFAAGAEPTPVQQRAAERMAVRQTAVQFAVWALGGTVFMLVNLDAVGGVAYVIGAAILFGGTSAACIGYLVTQRTLRPILAAAMRNRTAAARAPGVLGRLVITWVLFTGLPAAGIALIVLAQSHGWFVQKSAPVDTPILVLAAVSLLLGSRAMVLAGRSISDPVGEVIDGMNEVEHGRYGARVEVYEPSEIGRLQSGFNRMVAGLAERERLRELFGRHVGADVAAHALEQETSFSGDVREVGVLYVDLSESTAMAASRPPQEVARVLNDFFQIVVAAVDSRHGLINKFEGDAVLAVFGAPLSVDRPASAALATARALAPQLRRLPTDFGVGVSAGSVFAGNIGAENRYEYTVIGDAVNEAARLADHAKAVNSRVLASGSALVRADTAERELWSGRGSTVLRGRSAPTDLAEPVAGE
jgi:adenylate cyclase